MKAVWLALHIFYGGDQDRLLLEAVRPTLQRLRSEGGIYRHFFVRYWNGGPHIRVRVQCLQSDSDVERQLECGIAPFLHQAPGAIPEVEQYESDVARMHEVEERLGAAFVGAVEPYERLQPPNSIQRRPYDFDVRRYAAATIEDTHDHAWLSSELAFATLEISQTAAGLIRMFSLHAAAITARLLDAVAGNAADYFEEASRWGQASGSSDGQEYWAKSGFMAYEGQRQNLDTVRRLLDGQAISTTSSWSVVLQAWESELHRRRAYLADARQAKEIQVEPDHLVLDALHLFCNRLGLNLTIECYIYYLIARLLRERAKESVILAES